MPQVELSDDYLHQAQGLIYNRWSEAFDNLKHAKAEKPDYNIEPYWDQMHATRLENATRDLAYWSRLRNESIPVSPLTRKGSPFNP